MDRSILEEILEARRDKRLLAVATDLESAATIAVHPGPPHADDHPVAAAARGALIAGAPALAEAGGRSYFINVFAPPLELVIIGAVHIAQVLAPMAALAGYGVTVIDPRTAFADAERFPGVRLVTSWPDEALAAEPPGERTALVTLTHDPKLDDAALIPALASKAFYIGALGSKKTQQARQNRLERAGLAPEAIARVHGPVGLDIGAKSAGEIALAILAEMTAVLRGRAP